MPTKDVQHSTLQRSGQAAAGVPDDPDGLGSTQQDRILGVVEVGGEEILCDRNTTGAIRGDSIRGWVGGIAHAAAIVDLERLTIARHMNYYATPIIGVLVGVGGTVGLTSFRAVVSREVGQLFQPTVHARADWSRSSLGSLDSRWSGADQPAHVVEEVLVRIGHRESTAGSAEPGPYVADL